jgi:hypothetical protein
MADMIPTSPKVKAAPVSPIIDYDSDDGELNNEQVQISGPKPLRARHSSTGGPIVDQTGVVFKKEVITEVYMQ